MKSRIMAGMLIKMKSMVKVATVAVTVSTVTVTSTSLIVAQQVENNKKLYSDCTVETTNVSVGSYTGIQAEVIKALAKKGYGKAAIAGIMGNIMQECSWNPECDGAAWGLFQFDKAAGLYAEFCQYCEEHHTSLSDISAQIEYQEKEVENGFNYYTGKPTKQYKKYPGCYNWPVKMTVDEFKRIKDPEEAALIYSRVVERPGRPMEENRMKYAREAYDNMGKESVNCRKSNGTVDSYINFMMDIADDDSHGYSQASRNLNPDTDCSGLVYFALLNAGLIEDQGYPWDTGSMGEILEKSGFKKYKFSVSSLQRGDIMVKPNNEGSGGGHTEVYIGENQSVGAHTGNLDGKPGDSSGREISVTQDVEGSYGNYYYYIYRLE